MGAHWESSSCDSGFETDDADSPFTLHPASVQLAGINAFAAVSDEFKISESDVETIEPSDGEETFEASRRSSMTSMESISRRSSMVSTSYGVVSCDVQLPRLWRDPRPSAGSVQHGLGECKPCAWFWKPHGCKWSGECTYCHMCPPGELRTRKKAKVAQLKLGADAICS